MPKAIYIDSVNSRKNSSFFHRNRKNNLKIHIYMTYIYAYLYQSIKQPSAKGVLLRYLISNFKL